VPPSPGRLSFKAGSQTAGTKRLERMDPEIQFTQAEIEFINSQPLARIGTASAKGRPDVAVVGFDFDGTYFYVSGRNNETTWKYKNTKGNPLASLVIDDLPSIKPWLTRGL
jgi:pyridoxamine 5'-phosphate oxidase family protein